MTRLGMTPLCSATPYQLDNSPTLADNHSIRELAFQPTSLLHLDKIQLLLLNCMMLEPNLRPPAYLLHL